MSSSNANNIPAPYTSLPSKEATSAGPFPAFLLRNAGTLVIQLVLGQLPTGRLLGTDVTSAAGRPSYYMKVEPEMVIHCPDCRILRGGLADLQVRLAGPLTVLLAANESLPALLEELCRELHEGAAGISPFRGSRWCRYAFVRQTVGMLVRHWPVITAVAQLLTAKGEVAPLDLLEVVVPVLCRTGPLSPELWQLIRLGEDEAREAVVSCARRTDQTMCSSPEELRPRAELWRWESLALQVEEAEMAWGPPRSAQHAVLAAATATLRPERRAADGPDTSVPHVGGLIRVTQVG